MNTWTYFTSKLLTNLTTLLVLFLISTTSVLAQPNPPAQSAVDDPIGTISKPLPVQVIDERAGVSADSSGLIFFVNMIIRIVTLVAGIWVVFNFVLAGYYYIFGGGDAKAHSQVADLLTTSVIGLVCIIASYSVAGLVGYIFYGDAGFILNPTFGFGAQIL